MRYRAECPNCGADAHETEHKDIDCPKCGLFHSAIPCNNCRAPILRAECVRQNMCQWEAATPSPLLPMMEHPRDCDCDGCYDEREGPSSATGSEAAPRNAWDVTPQDDERPIFASLEGYCEHCGEVVQCHRRFNGKLTFYERSDDDDHLEPHTCKPRPQSFVE
jgi:hypothetical protein